MTCETVTPSSRATVAYETSAAGARSWRSNTRKIAVLPDSSHARRNVVHGACEQRPDHLVAKEAIEVAEIARRDRRQLPLGAGEIERQVLGLAAALFRALRLLRVLHEPIEAGAQERAELRLRGVVAFDVALLERHGEERLHDVLGRFGREPPVQAQVVIARAPVAGGEIAERHAPHVGIVRANALDDRPARRRKRNHPASVSQPARAMEREGFSRAADHPAAGSNCMTPNSVPSVSVKYAVQPTPGTAIFGTASGAAGGRDRPRDLVHRFDGDHVGGRLTGLLALGQAAVDPRALAGLDHPVVHRPVPLLEAPAEGSLIERHAPRRVVGGQLEVHNPHRLFPPAIYYTREGYSFSGRAQRGMSGHRNGIGAGR